MAGINLRRWLLGGIAAGALIWLLEGAASLVYMEDAQAALAAHDLAMELTAGTWALTIIVSLISGLALVFFYAAARSRFGPGPRTAVIVAVALWVAAYLLSLLGYQMIGLYPSGMLVLWGAVGLVELILAGLLGAWIYREGASPPRTAAARP